MTLVIMPDLICGSEMAPNRRSQNLPVGNAMTTPPRRPKPSKAPSKALTKEQSGKKLNTKAAVQSLSQ